jgi:hypothetical protein
MAQATYDDVNLILRLYDLRREETLRAARTWFVKHCRVKTFAELNELCPMGSDTNAYFRQAVSYWDMAASFVTAGVLNQTLFFESNRELLFFWIRLQPVIGEIRAAYSDPNYLKNLEKVGTAYAEHLGPKVYESYAARVRG